MHYSLGVTGDTRPRSDCCCGHNSFEVGPRAQIRRPQHSCCRSWGRCMPELRPVAPRVTPLPRVSPPSPSDGRRRSDSAAALLVRRSCWVLAWCCPVGRTVVRSCGEQPPVGGCGWSPRTFDPIWLGAPFIHSQRLWGMRMNIGTYP